MTYDEAKDWLVSVSGIYRGAHPKSDASDQIEVIARGKQARALFSRRLKGEARRDAEQKAFIEACESLRDLIEREGASSGQPLQS